MSAEKKKRGFACISPERVKEISSLGGKAAWANGKAHRFTSEEARAAGRKGGLTTMARRATPSTTSPLSIETPNNEVPDAPI